MKQINHSELNDITGGCRCKRWHYSPRNYSYAAPPIATRPPVVITPPEGPDQGSVTPLSTRSKTQGSIDWSVN